MGTGTRIFVWLASMGLGQVTSFLVAEAKGPDLPVAVKLVIGVLAGVMFGVVFEALARQQTAALDAVARGDLGACTELLARRRAGNLLADADVAGSAALRIAVGAPEEAGALLRQVVARVGPAARVLACVEAHVDLASRDPALERAALDRLLATKGFGGGPRERYRAFLLATAASRVAERDRGAAARALPALAGARDEEARAFASWVRCALDAPVAPGEREDEARRGARLAEAHRLVELARKVDARAAEIARARAQGGPYRR